ncbi:peptidylprolyl isomerase [Marinifilum sp. RC60d5]|uniref:peptidylprolyl isomerase n=1 Tax=Marinifilum sp. RC60d5 TaxID=3458414 RepID=UPI00403609C2
MKRIFLLLLIIPLFYCCVNSQNQIIEIKTSLGNIDLEIYTDKAPLTATHFLNNIDKNIFQNACFYRVVRPNNQPNNKIKIEVVQGGLFHDSIVDNMPTIKHESTKTTGILHKNGVISMARLEPGSACTEFFICVGNQPELDYNGNRNPDKQGFAAFGKVISGMDIVKKIQNMEDKNQMLTQTIPILSIKRK